MIKMDELWEKAVTAYSKSFARALKETFWKPSVNVAEFLDEIRKDGAQIENNTPYHSRVLLWLGIIRPKGPI
jgi:hypothetical protein